MTQQPPTPHTTLNALSQPQVIWLVAIKVPTTTGGTTQMKLASGSGLFGSSSLNLEDQVSDVVKFISPDATTIINHHILVRGLEINGLDASIGASTRPTLTVTREGNQTIHDGSGTPIGSPIRRLATALALGDVHNLDRYARIDVTIWKCLLGDTTEQLDAANPTYVVPVIKNYLARYDFLVDRIARQTPYIIELELGNRFDLRGIQFPTRSVVPICQHIYRGAACGYTGTNYFDAQDNSVPSATDDVCGHHLSSCQKRFTTGALPFGGFPFAPGLRRPVRQTVQPRLPSRPIGPWRPFPL